MANYPTSLDSFPDPLANSPLNSPAHSSLHQDINDAVEKIEAKVGLTNSPASGATNGKVLMADGSGGSAWSDIEASDVKTGGAAARSVLISDGAGSGTWSQAAGLWLVKSQVVGTAVSSVEVTAAFNADFDNYLITWTGGVLSAGNANMRMVLGATATGYYSQLVYAVYGNTTTVFANATDNNAVRWSFVGAGHTTYASVRMNLYNPFLSTRTLMSVQFADNVNAGNGNGYLNDANSYTSFTISPATGTMTGGTVRVYGYTN